MNRSKYLKGPCQHCGGNLEFLADHIGMSIPCPHCGQETELVLARPPEQSTIPRRAIVWTAVAALVLILGLVGALIALKRAQRWAETQKRQNAIMSVSPVPTTRLSGEEETNSPAQNGLLSSTVTLDHAAGTSLVYAIGTITNTSDRQRFGLKVELELDDAAGQKLGIASDYRQVLEPGAEWQFKALVVDSKAKSAKVTSIHEDR